MSRDEPSISFRNQSKTFICQIFNTKSPKYLSLDILVPKKTALPVLSRSARRRWSARALPAGVMMADALGRLRWVSFLASLLLFWMIGSLALKLPDEEVEALKEIAKKLKMESWDFNVNPCSSRQWTRASAGGITSNVTCDCSFNQSTVCHVNVIQLKGMNLTGVLPKEFANLQFLVDIDLSLNFLSGPIPKEWASLPLTHLSVMGNRISGTIPKEFGHMTKLTSLVVNDNSLNGSLPEELGNLVNLTEL